MSQVIYGLFDTRNAAEDAIEAIEAQTGNEGTDALVHEGHLRDEDVQMGGTDALKGAILGATVVGIVAAFIGALILVPTANLSIGWSEWVFMALGGTIMGITAGAVAGASEPRKELIAMARRLDEGKVLVTMASDLDPATITEVFGQHGAVEVRAA